MKFSVLIKKVLNFYEYYFFISKSVINSINKSCVKLLG